MGGTVRGFFKKKKMKTFLIIIFFTCLSLHIIITALVALSIFFKNYNVVEKRDAFQLIVPYIATLAGIIFSFVEILKVLR